MGEEDSRTILRDMINADQGLSCSEPLVLWKSGDKTAYLNGQFKPDELEAMAYWMKNQG